MNVELAEEQILLLADRFTIDHAEGRAWVKRTDAFDAFAKLGGFLSKPKDEDYEVVYRERFIPGANLAKIAIVKGLKIGAKS